MQAIDICWTLWLFGIIGVACSAVEGWMFDPMIWSNVPPGLSGRDDDLWPPLSVIKTLVSGPLVLATSGPQHAKSGVTHRIPGTQSVELFVTIHLILRILGWQLPQSIVYVDHYIPRRPKMDRACKAILAPIVKSCRSNTVEDPTEWDWGCLQQLGW